jgi:hypothetical protein
MLVGEAILERNGQALRGIVADPRLRQGQRTIGQVRDQACIRDGDRVERRAVPRIPHDHESGA